jgi:hypothetical protein
MTRYFFIIRWESDDPEGTLLPSESAARLYANRIIRELKDAGGYDDPGLMMIVEDADARVVFAAPF